MVQKLFRLLNQILSAIKNGGGGGGGGGDASAANQATQITLETTIRDNTNNLDVASSTRASEATLAAADTKLGTLNSTVATETTLSLISTTQATETKQDAAIVELAEINQSLSNDAFGRLRVSDTGNRLDVEFNYDIQPNYFDRLTNGGSAEVAWDSTNRDVALRTGSAVDGDYAWLSSYPVPYTPGNSQLIDITGVLDYADLGTGTAEVFLRSNVNGTVTEEIITQAAWTQLNAGIDWSYSQIFSIDFQSLKVGAIRFGLVQGDEFKQVAEITNDNERSTGYWENPNLPVMWRVYNTATETLIEAGYGNEENAVGFRYRMPVNALAQTKFICSTVKSEGGHPISEMRGLPREIDMEQSTTTVSTTLIPLISIRAKDTFQGKDNLVLSIPTSYSLICDESIRLVIMVNPTLTGAVWNDVNADDSTIEYDTSATALATQGTVIYSDYIFADASGFGAPGSASKESLLGKSVLWNRKDDNLSGIVSICAVRYGGTDSDVSCGIRWEELR